MDPSPARDLPPETDAATTADRSRALEAVTCVVAHKLNNLFTAILSSVELALTTEELTEELRDNLRNALRSARDGARLTGGLFLMNRQVSGRSARIDAARLLEEAVVQTQSLVRSDHRLELEPLPDGLWMISADDWKLARALAFLFEGLCGLALTGSRLVIQAANVTRAGGTESSGPAGEYVQITARYPGEPMAGVLWPEVVKSGGVLAEALKGPRLALLTASYVLSESGGWLEADSDLEGGCQVRILLCRGRIEESPFNGTAAERAVEKRLDGNESILVVARDEVLRCVVRSALSYRGYEIVEAAGVEEAARKVAGARQATSLIVMEADVWGKEGRDVIGAINGTGFTSRPVRLILIGGGGEGGPEIRAPGWVVGDHLRAPVDTTELVRSVRRALDEGGCGYE